MSAVRSLLEAGQQGQWDVMIAGPTVLTIGDSMNPFMSVNTDSALKVLIGLIQGPMVLISHRNSDLDNWQKIKRSKRRLRIGVSGLGSPAHFVAAHLDKTVFAMGDAYNTDGDLPSMENLAKGELDLAVISIGSLLPPLAQHYRVLLTSGAEPIEWNKNNTVPTMASVADTPEAQAFHFYNWLSVCASADMPLHMQQGITEAIRSIKTAGAFAAVTSASRHQVMHTTPSDLQQQILQSRDLLEQYILRADLSNTLGMALTH
jgi:tripartite-type tricarboxylate transporter receptor subunit TctC